LQLFAGLHGGATEDPEALLERVGLEQDGDKLVAEFSKGMLQARALDIRTTIERSSDQTTAVRPDSAIGRLTRVDAVQAGYVSDALRREMRAELARIERAEHRRGHVWDLSRLRRRALQRAAGGEAGRKSLY
jgi:hypothetical protein